MTFKVLLVGLGAVGVSVDSLAEPKTVVLSHARAITRHPSFNILAGVDPVEEKREAFRNLYGFPALNSISMLDRNASPDIVVIATPPDTRASVYEETLENLSPRLVLLEKPIAASIAEEDRIAELAIQKRMPTLVNYFRRVDPSFGGVRNLLLSGAFDGPFTGVCWYSKGAYNSASHFLDLLTGWFGPFETTRARAAFEHTRGHRSAFFTVVNDRAEIHFVPIRESLYYHNSLEIYGRNGRLSYDFGGAKVSFSPSGESPRVPQYAMLSDHPLSIKSDLYRSLYTVYSDLERFFQGDEFGLPDLNTALLSTRPLRQLRERGFRL